MSYQRPSYRVGRPHYRGAAAAQQKAAAHRYRGAAATPAAAAASGAAAPAAAAAAAAAASGGGHHPGLRTFVPHLPFDLTQCQSHFPPSGEAADDKALSELLMKRNTDLSPNPQEQQALAGLLAKIQAVFDSLIINPESFDAAQVAEVRPVGSQKKGTMLSGCNTADLVVIFRTLPTKEAVRSVTNRVLEEVKSGPDAKFITASQQEYGFEISNAEATVKILVTTVPNNLKLLDPELHIEPRIQQGSLAAIRHSRWFEENAQHSSVKVLIRLLKDLRRRFSGLGPLSPWIMDLLAHYAVMQNPLRQPLPLAQAFKRSLQLLAAGLFLPGSAGIIDPCEPGQIRVHTALSLQQQDQVCYTAQALLRVLSHGGAKHLLGFEGSARIATEISVWRGIVVTPPEPAYHPPAEADNQPKQQQQQQQQQQLVGGAAV